eukprot:8547734-Pyramimonas_sp.AAC.1
MPTGVKEAYDIQSRRGGGMGRRPLDRKWLVTRVHGVPNVWQISRSFKNPNGVLAQLAGHQVFPNKPTLLARSPSRRPRWPPR